MLLDKKFIIEEIPIVYRDRPEGSVSKLNTVKWWNESNKNYNKMFKDFKPRQFSGVISLNFCNNWIDCWHSSDRRICKTGYITKVPSAILATGIMTIALIIGQCGVILDTVVKQNRENYELQLSRFTDIENLKNK